MELKHTFVGCRIWRYMPSELKESISLNEFRSKKKLDTRKLSAQTQRIILSNILSKNWLPKNFCSQILLFMCLSFFVCLFCWGFFSVCCCCCFVFCSSAFFSFNPHFNVDLNQLHISDKSSKAIFVVKYIFCSSVVFIDQL